LAAIIINKDGQDELDKTSLIYTWGIDFVLILKILFILVKGFVSSTADLEF